MKTTRIAIAICAVTMLSAPPAFAANDDVGETATADTEITLEVNDLVVLSGVPATVDLGNYTGDGDTIASIWEPVCVGTNNAAGNYTVTASGDGAASAFTLTDGSETIAYAVGWAASDDGTGGAGLTATVASGTLVGHDTLGECPATDNASFRITITEAAAQAVHSGIYSGTLTFLITPA